MGSAKRRLQPENSPWPPFHERFPWLGADLQTLRNTLRSPKLPRHTYQTLEFALPRGDRLVARLDLPHQGEIQNIQRPLGLVVVLHGLGGSSDDLSQCRLSFALGLRGFAVLRLNLRGAGPGRSFAKGTYAASCSIDLLPVLQDCRRLASELFPSSHKPLPLAAVGLSLGGTVFLNTLLDARDLRPPTLDALVCISSPLDLPGCADQMERPRNFLYHRWLLRRLISQTLADPFGLTESEHEGLRGARRPQSIRAFDDLITAPRWGFPNVTAYYEACSPLKRLCESVNSLPPILLVHAHDDPWVPVAPTLSLAQEVDAAKELNSGGVDGNSLEVLISARGGHNGFHASGDRWSGCWSDWLASSWLHRVLLTGLS